MIVFDRLNAPGILGIYFAGVEIKYVIYLRKEKRVPDNGEHCHCLGHFPILLHWATYFVAVSESCLDRVKLRMSRSSPQLGPVTMV